MCERFAPELAFCVSGGVTPPQRALIERHLAGCPSCRAEIAEWAAIATGVRTAATAWVLPVPSVAPLLDAIRTPHFAARGGDGAHAGRGGLRDALGKRVRAWLGALFAVLLFGLIALLVADRVTRRVPPGGSRRPTLVAPIAGVSIGLGRAADPDVVASPLPAGDAGAGEAPSGDLPGSGRTLEVAGSPARSPVPTTGPGGVEGERRVVSRRGSASSVASTAPVATLLPTTVDATGTIVGRITGPDGRPRAEIQVIATGDADGFDQFRAYSDATGSYRLVVPPGRWLIHVEAPAYQLQWHPHAATPYEAVAVDVVAGQIHGGTDFALVPYPRGHITGRVTSAVGAPLAQVVVVAVPLWRVPGQGDPLNAAVTVYTDDDGRYTLFVDPGDYAVGVSPDWRSAPIVWWHDRVDLAEAETVAVATDGPDAVADFEAIPDAIR
jgi:hypothetical protein